MFPAHPLAGAVATGRYRGPSTTAGASGKFSCPAGALSQWGDKVVLGVYEGGTAQTLWAQAAGHRARTGRPRGCPSLSADGRTALGKRQSARDVELSVDRGNLS